MADQPWYRDGLRFQCTGCGGCCGGAPGFVWVDEQEIADLAEALEMTVDEFMDRFTRRIGLRYSLVEYSDGDCVFLDPESKKCLVYPVRPVQCRTWPFWTSNIESPKAWKETCEKCPGSGKGQLYSIGEIHERASERPGL